MKGAFKLTGPDIESPFAGIDLERLDGDFLSLLRYAAAEGQIRNGRIIAGRGLTARERRIFRFGVMVGLGEWGPACEVLGSLADEGFLTGPEIERTVAEAGLVKGLPACMHLGPALAARGLRGPSSVAEAVMAVQSARAAGNAGLSDRELFGLGLGVTWGARCWDT